MSALTILKPAAGGGDLACGQSSQCGKHSPCGKRGRSVKCVLVDNFFHTGKRSRRPLVSPHLGLMLLASVLEKAGHVVEIFDPKILFAEDNWRSGTDERFLDASARDLIALNADVIGFTAYGRSLAYAISVAQRIKAINPSISVVFGGPHPTILAKEILQAFSCVDVVVRYEAELIVVDLMERLAADEPLDDVPNVVFRRQDKLVATRPQENLVDLEGLPKPALHLYPIERLGLEELTIEAGRGCPFKCTFCSTSKFFQRKYRTKSAERMIEEMEWAKSKYQINKFNLNHDLFGLSKKSVMEFCRQVKPTGLRWKCSVRPDTIDEEMIAAFADSGCEYLFLGVETGSPRMQRVIGKKLNLDTTLETIGRLMAMGITCTASFITGFPEETIEDQNQTLDMIGRLISQGGTPLLIQLHVLSPEPGSELATGLNDGIAFDGVGPEADEQLDHELIQKHAELFTVYYHFKSAVGRRRTLLASAFVMTLMPELGFPLVTHLSARLCGGRLSQLFEKVIDGAADSSGLRAGIDRIIQQSSAEMAYLSALVRLGRMLTEVQGSHQARIGHFEYPVARLADWIMLHPAKTPPDEMTRREPCECAVSEVIG
jgi:radical SAM superfamily enzyme YgiQ (UPF0313 family)